MNIFRQQAVPVTKLERIDKPIARLLLLARHPKRVDQPESADQECSLGQTEIIRTGIPHNMLLPPQLSVHGLQGTNEFRVIWFNQAEFREQQDAGIEVIA